MLQLKTVAASMIYSHIAHDPWKDQRLFFRRHPAMAKIDGRHVGKTEDRQQRLKMMLAVNDIGRRADAGEIIHDWNRGCSKPFGHTSQHRAERNRLMATFEQFNGNVVNIELASGPVIQRIIRQQDAQ